MVTQCAWNGGLSSSTTWVQVYAALFCPFLLLFENFIDFNYSDDIVIGDMQSVMLTSVTAELNALKERLIIFNDHKVVLSILLFLYQGNIEAFNLKSISVQRNFRLRS